MRKTECCEMERNIELSSHGSILEYNLKNHQFEYQSATRIKKPDFNFLIKLYKIKAHFCPK